MFIFPSLHCRAASEVPYTKSKVAKDSLPLSLLIHCLFFDILLSKALEFSSGLPGWHGPIGLGEMKCDIAGFEISSHAQETKCFSHWSFFQKVIDDSKFSIPSIIKKKKTKIFFLCCHMERLELIYSIS